MTNYIVIVRTDYDTGFWMYNRDELNSQTQNLSKPDILTYSMNIVTYTVQSKFRNSLIDYIIFFLNYWPCHWF